MTEALHLRVVRPYATEEAFLLAESWSINQRSLLLVGIPAHPEGTVARVELLLESGTALIVAEGIVVKHLAETATRPAGLVLRFQRMSAKTSEFVKRAVQFQAERAPNSSLLPSHPSVVQAPLQKAPLEPAKQRKKPSSSKMKAANRVSQPPSSSVTHGHTDDRSSIPPGGPQAQRASVIPAARRVSTRPPTSPESTASLGVPPLPKSKLPKAFSESTSELKPGGNVSVTPKVTTESAHRDTSAMDRLRQRDGSKPITVPPDREAVLARLKKP
jgi:hypothetical protein